MLHHRRLVKDDWVRWQKILYKKGWLAGHWPREYGGCAWTPVQPHIFDEECGDAGAPRLMPFGLVMVAPVIMDFGSPWQKEHYLPRILSSEDWWCQGYSEPGSGSDLASLKTRAVREGDHYIVNGQKTWTTLAQYADMIFCLVRTDPTVKKQEGITFLLIDMHSPGVTVRPIITLDEEHEVNEVFFDNVKVPAENLVGEEGKGWTYAKFLLGHERTGIARVGESKRELAQLKEIAAKQLNGRPLAEDPLFRARIAEVEIELMALEMTLLRVLSSRAKPGPEASILKIKGTEVQQALTELMMEAMGPYALPFRRSAIDAGRHGERGRARIRRAARRALLQLPQDHDLRRLERDPAQHHRADGAGALTMDFTFSEEQQQLRDRSRNSSRKEYGFEARQAIIASEKG